MSGKLLRKNIIITNTFSSSGTFTSNIYVPFTPDEVRVKSVVLGNEANADNINIRVMTNLLRDDNELCIIGNTAESIVINYHDLAHMLEKPINGSYDFTLLNNAGATLSISTTFGLHLEFVKHREP